jgi:glycosyltransferase involved in cell wall biosynthesis
MAAVASDVGGSIGSELLMSVIIPTCDRPAQLAACLERLSPGQDAVAGVECEVIVSDDGLTDETRELIGKRFPWVTWRRGPRRGPAANRNAGAGMARGDWLVFTDDDCLPEAGWLASYAAAIQATPSAAALEGAILPTEPIDRLSARCPVNLSGGRFWSANIAVRRALFLRIGGFSPLFPYPASEDQDLYYRLQGVTAIPFVAAARVKHPVTRPTVRQLTAGARSMVYSHTVLCLRHPGKTGCSSLARGTLNDVLFQLRVIKRSVPGFDWRSMTVAAVYLTWGVLCGWWYYVTLRQHVLPIAVTSAR